MSPFVLQQHKGLDCGQRGYRSLFKSFEYKNQKSHHGGAYLERTNQFRRVLYTENTISNWPVERNEEAMKGFQCNFCFETIFQQTLSSATQTNSAKLWHSCLKVERVVGLIPIAASVLFFLSNLWLYHLIRSGYS